MNVLILINVHFSQNLASFIDKILPFLINFLMHYIRISQQPLVFGSPFIINLFGRHFIHQIEIDGNQQVRQ